MDRHALPLNWPLDVMYARELAWSAEFPSELRDSYNTEYNIGDLVVVQREGARCSLRARYDMPVGAFLGDVIGTVRKEEELGTQNIRNVLPLCAIPAIGNLVLDLTQNSNEARYMKFSKKNYNVRLHRAFISGTIRVLIEIVEPIAEGQEIVAELLNGNMTDGGSNDMDTPLGTSISFSSSFTAAELDLFREVVSTWTLIAEIREIADPDHICYGQRGLYAVLDLPAGAYLGEYTGLVQYTAARNQVTQTYYMLDYDNVYEQYTGHVVIDAATMGNEARYINDYKRIRSAPNVSFNKVWLSDKLTSLVVTLAPIKRGEELVASYGNTYWRYS